MFWWRGEPLPCNVPGNVLWTAKWSQHDWRTTNATMTNHASHFQEARGPTLMQINVEGLTKGYARSYSTLSAETSRREYTPIGNPLDQRRTPLDRMYWMESFSGDPLQSIAAFIDGVTTIHMYKPPNIPFTHLPQYPHSAIYAGDFNCQHAYGVTEMTQPMEQCSTIGHST